ncbi:MAG: TolC family protein [Desulfuromonadales bacterium]
MKFLGLRCGLNLLLVPMFTVVLSGCAPPDRWDVFDKNVALQTLPLKPDPEIEAVAIQLPVDAGLVEKELDQIPSRIDVETAVLLALRNNRDLQIQKLGPVIAGAFTGIERGAFDPEVFTELEYFDERANETSRSTGEEFSVSGQDAMGSIGLRQQLPTGTTLAAELSQNRTISNRAPEQQTARFGLSVTQSLLQGFGPAVNLARVRQADIETLASFDQLRGFTESLLADTEIAYWQYVLAHEEIAIFENSQDIARKQREEIALRVEVGLLPEIELAAAKAEEALRVQALIDARSQMEERRLRLLKLISPGGAVDAFATAITTTSEPRMAPLPITDLDDRLKLADQSRPDLAEARRRLQQRQLETVVTRNGLLPKLELFIELGKTGYADTFSDSMHNLDGNTYDWTAGIRLNHFLGNRAAKSRNLIAYAERQQANEAVANLRQLVHLDVRLAVNEVERLRQQIDATRATRIFQEQTLNAEKERFDVGASTSLQIAQAQRDLLRIQIAEVEAIINYRIALVSLYLAEGSLLERRGIQIDDTERWSVGM